MMKTLSLTSLLAIAAAAALGAQAATEIATTTNIQMRGGKGVTLRGCVEADPDGGYLLTHVVDKDGVSQRYVLVTTNAFFSTHVGQRVQVEGKLGDRTHGHVDVVTDTKTDGVNAHVETNARNDAAATRYLGPDHMKTLATSCP
jgi:hypothetical protein